MAGKASFHVRGIVLPLADGTSVILNAGDNMQIFPSGDLITFSAQMPPNLPSPASSITGLVTAGTNVTITGAGTAASPYIISAAGGSSFAWNEITTTTVALAVNNGYIMNNASRITGTLPAVAAFGSEIKIGGKGAGGWKVAQNAGQTIHFDGNNTTTGVAGSLSSQSTFDCMTLLCITANTDFLVTTSLGNITGI